MAAFKDHKITVNQLLGFIPEALLSHLSSTTKVDHYSKVLHGRKVFYLLLYGILDNEKLSQRSLEDTFNSTVFKALFNLDETETVRRSSISERLSIIDSNYFREIYECIYQRFAENYDRAESSTYNLIRVDSTIVSEAAGKLKEGIDQKSGKNLVKYSISFDGLFPCGAEVFNQQRYSAEDNALPEAVLKHVKKQAGHSNIYIMDRGVQSSRTLKDFSKNNVFFVVRAKENRKYQEIENLIKPGQDMKLGELDLLIDSKVKIYTGIPINNKRGKIHYREQLLEEPFRLVVARSKTEPKNEFWFITNEFDISPQEVARFYRKRWDIEVFFRFLKQELNLSHLVSLNKNGMEAILYMTLIVAMLILIYKKANNIGYKTAKRRFVLELRELVIALAITLSGGNPDKLFKT